MKVRKKLLSSKNKWKKFGYPAACDLVGLKILLNLSFEKDVVVRINYQNNGMHRGCYDYYPLKQ